MCKTKKEFDKLVERERVLSAAKQKTDAELKQVKAEMQEYAQSKGTLEGTSYVVYGKGYKVMIIQATNSEPDRELLKKMLGTKYDSILKKTSYSSVRVY